MNKQHVVLKIERVINLNRAHAHVQNDPQSIQ